MLVRLLLQATKTIRSPSLACLLLFLSFVSISPAHAGGGPRNVLVVRNLDSTESKQIANYYVSARHIPPENICDIRCTTSEQISSAVCERDIVAPIRAFLQKPEIADHIDYIVITRGIPLAADYGYTSGPLSVASILTCVGDQRLSFCIRNPYGPEGGAPIETAFSHQLKWSDRLYWIFNFQIYLVTRLDGYTLSDIYRTIDDSIAASNAGGVSPDCVYLLDAYVNDQMDGNKALSPRLVAARDLLMSKGVPVVYDYDNCLFLSGYSNVMGYSGWGDHDPAFTYAAYRNNSFAPGSLADTFVSTNARTFYPTDSGQALIGDLITCGACGVCGYVSEPSASCATYPNILFDRYTKGYNMAESFYMACPEIYWKAVMVGDPLMAPYAVAPRVSLVIPHEPLTGPAARVVATASHPNGISSVDFYFDGQFAGKSTSAPYGVDIDTTKCVVGSHSVEVIAYENSPVATQASAKANLEVANPISCLKHISDAYHSPDGQIVTISGVIVTAGTAEMGGDEFYVEDAKRASGIRVSGSQIVKEGDIVDLTGVLTTVSGERTIAVTEVSVTQSLPTALCPLLMKTAVIGGGNWGPNTPGITGGTGLRNLGLLVKVAGKVTYVGGADEPFFYIDDGCKLADTTGHVGLRVECRDMQKPVIRSFVAATGVSSCWTFGGAIVRSVKPRRTADIACLAVTP